MIIENLTNLEKYDINNFYIGELCLTQKIDTTSYLRSKYPEKLIKKKNLLIKGAINLQKNNFSEDAMSFERREKYYKVLTIFYKYNNNYLCLHDGNIYGISTIDFCNNLIKLPVMLPKIGYNIPEKLTFKETLLIFENLFEPTISLEKMYNNDKYKINDLYIGNLVLYTEFLSLGQSRDKKEINLPIRYILEKNSKLIGISSNSIKEADSINKNLPIGKYKYTHFKCLFLKLPNGLYNINDFQIYTKGISKITSQKNRPIGESYYEKLVPLAKELDKSPGNKISIPSVLSKIKRI